MTHVDAAPCRSSTRPRPEEERGVRLAASTALSRGTERGTQLSVAHPGSARDAAVLRERINLEPSLLDEGERLDVYESSDAEAELAARLEAAREADFATEAAMIIQRVRACPPEESLTPEELEEEQEGAGEPAEVSLHEQDEEEALVEALLDEGERLEGFEEDLLEYEMEGQREAESPGE